MPTYTIQCYIETISSDNKITLRGSDGYRLLKEEESSDNTKIQKKYLVFFENTQKCTLIEELTEFTQVEFDGQMQNMLLLAYVNRKKVELKCNLQIEDNTIEITKVKLLQ